MAWTLVRGTVLNEGVIQRGIKIARTLLVQTENGRRVVIAPKDRILNKLSAGDIIEFETRLGKDARLTWFWGRTKSNCKNLRIIST